MAEISDLVDGEVDFWFVHIPSWRSYLDRLQDTLQEDERRHAARFRFVADRERFVVGRSLLRLVLAGWLDCSPSAVAFQHEEFGKPFVAGRRPEFNISHSGDWILMAVSPDRRVGADVELMRAEALADGLVTRVFSPEEVAEFHRRPEPERLEAFVRVWTRKEALVKAAGLGLRAPLREITVGTGRRGEGFKTVRDVAGVPGEWSLTSLAIEAGYQAALAVEGRPPRRLARLRPKPGRPFPRIRFEPETASR